MRLYARLEALRFEGSRDAVSLSGSASLLPTQSKSKSCSEKREEGMRKFLDDWLTSLEESDAKLKDQGYTVIHGAGISYLIPSAPLEEATSQNEHVGVIASLWAKMYSRRQYRARSETNNLT